jgi:hypothetical protein
MAATAADGGKGNMKLTKSKIITAVMGVIAIGMALAFFAVPVLKIKDPAMIIVILIGVAAMVYNFIEVLREDDRE